MALAVAPRALAAGRYLAEVALPAGCVPADVHWDGDGGVEQRRRRGRRRVRRRPAGDRGADAVCVGAGGEHGSSYGVCRLWRCPATPTVIACGPRADAPSLRLALTGWVAAGGGGEGWPCPVAGAERGRRLPGGCGCGCAAAPSRLLASGAAAGARRAGPRVRAPAAVLRWVRTPTAARRGGGGAVPRPPASRRGVPVGGGPFGPGPPRGASSCAARSAARGRPLYATLRRGGAATALRTLRARMHCVCVVHRAGLSIAFPVGTTRTLLGRWRTDSQLLPPSIVCGVGPL